jgi:putative transposase
MAVRQRRIQPGLIHHTDRGAQYSALAYQRQLTTLGLTPSMSRKGNCYDNAVAESFFSILKNELVHHQRYRTREDASREIFAFIEGFYNRQRLHQSLDYLTPLEFEHGSVTLNLVSTKPGLAQNAPLFAFRMLLEKWRRLER